VQLLFGVTLTSSCDPACSSKRNKKMRTNEKGIRHHGMRRSVQLQKETKIMCTHQTCARDASCCFLKKPRIHANPPSKSPSPFQIKPAQNLFHLEANKHRYSMKKKKKKKKEKKKKRKSGLMRSLLAPPTTQHAWKKSAFAMTARQRSPPSRHYRHQVWSLRSATPILRHPMATRRHRSATPGQRRCWQGQHSSTLASLAICIPAKQRLSPSWSAHWSNCIHDTASHAKNCQNPIYCDSSYNARLNLYMN